MSAQGVRGIADRIERGEPIVAGTVAPGFESVRERFAANFRRDDDCREIGASFAVFHGDRCVIDLWGGAADPAQRRAWNRDTLVNVYSTTKGVVACAIALLVDRGQLRYEDKVASVWPDFARFGKQDATIAHVLSHQVGLPAFERPTSAEDLYDWQGCCEALAAQTPRWTPGEKLGYHPMTYGFLAGEIARRAAGRTIGQIIASDLAGPLHADFHVGLPPTCDERVAELVAPKRMIDPTTLPLPEEILRSLTNPGLHPSVANTLPWRRAELPAVNGHGSAQGLARIYGPFANGGTFQGIELISAATIAKMTQVQRRGLDLLLGMEVSWACGLALNGTTGFFGRNPRTFGHSGWGGSFGCADPDARLAIGYVCNQMGPDLVGDVRARELCEEVYRCV
jgi:CubicO group peptidase (beta-lactamase class C family)